MLAVKVLMISIFKSHQGWVPDSQRPEGHMQTVKVGLAG